jgi:hypothetical protein
MTPATSTSIASTHRPLNTVSTSMTSQSSKGCPRARQASQRAGTLLPLVLPSTDETPTGSDQARPVRPEVPNAIPDGHIGACPSCHSVVTGSKNASRATIRRASAEVVALVEKAWARSVESASPMDIEPCTATMPAA